MPADGTLNVFVRVNSEGVEVSSAEGTVRFDPDRLHVRSLTTIGSLLTVAAEKPTFSNTSGTIHFSGGISDPGYIGPSGTLLQITFDVRAAGVTEVAFSSGEVRVKDGLDTNVLTDMRGASYSVTDVQPAPEVVQPTPEPRAPTDRFALQIASLDPDTLPVAVATPRQYARGGQGTGERMAEWLERLNEAIRTRSFGLAAASGNWLFDQLGPLMYPLVAPPLWAMLFLFIGVGVVVRTTVLGWGFQHRQGRAGRNKKGKKKFVGSKKERPSALQEVLLDIERELDVIEHLAKSRPLYPEEQFLESKLKEYRKKFHNIAGERPTPKKTAAPKKRPVRKKTAAPKRRLARKKTSTRTR